MRIADETKKALVKMGAELSMKDGQYRSELSLIVFLVASLVKNWIKNRYGDKFT